MELWEAGVVVEHSAAAEDELVWRYHRRTEGPHRDEAQMPLLWTGLELEVPWSIRLNMPCRSGAFPVSLGWKLEPSYNCRRKPCHMLDSGGGGAGD